MEDYDDNNFQSQNLHLAGETNNKHPPALQSFHLPKFDFEDSLNGHLRFESLVDTEGFLGIEGNQDNNWIEDFSRGSSSVVFSSSAAESCAISRHNNVWSEATSTESVEMLLKSVGQDDVIASEDTVKKSDTCDELGCITEQMEPSETCGEKSLSKDEAAILQPNQSLVETSGESSVSLEDVGLEQFVGQDTLTTGARELSVEGRNTILASETFTAEVAVSVSSHNDTGNAEQIFVEQDKIGTEIIECHLDKMEYEVSSDSRMEKIDGTDGSGQSCITSIAALNSQKALHLKDFIDTNNISDSMQSSNYNCEDLNRDGNSVSIEAHIDCHVVSSSKCENMEAEEVGNMVKPDLTPTELSDFPEPERRFQSPAALAAGGQDVSGLFNDSKAQCENVNASSGHASSTIQVAVDLSQQGTGEKNLPAEEKSELLSHKRLEIVASECESSLQNEIPAQARLVETSEGVCISPVDKMDESSKPVRVDGVYWKSAGNEGSVQSPISLEQRTDLTFNAYDADLDARNSPTIPGRTALGTFGNILRASASKLTESKSQSDTITGFKSRTYRQELNIDELKHVNDDKTPAASVVSSPKISSDVSEKSCVAESKKVSSCEPDDGQVLPHADVCGSSSQMDKQTCKHNEDTPVSTHKVESSLVSDGSKEAEAQDDVRKFVLQKSEETIQAKNLDADFKNVPGTKLYPSMDRINVQVDATSLDNLGDEVKKDGQEDNINTKPADNMKAESPILGTKGVVIKIAESSCVSTFPVPSVDSCVAGREKAVTDPGNPSTSLIGNKPSMPAGSLVFNRNDTSSGQMSTTSDTMPLADPSMKQAGEVSQAIYSSGAMLVSPVVVGYSSASSLKKTAARTSKGTIERKPRRTSKSTGKETSRKGNVVKETTLSISLQSGGKTSVFVQSSACTGQITRSTEKQQNPHEQIPAVKPFGNFPTPTLSLPDLNSSALSSLLQRPFTDVQQVQLRAQIFVYGALIQGTAPDEAYMISAFGGPDGGKGIWEKPWRACVERTQKSHAATPETPLQSRTAPGGPDLLPRTAFPGKMVIPSVGHTRSKDISTVNPIISLSSPLWSHPTPHDTLQSSSMQRGLATGQQPLLSSLHAHQTPPVKNIVGHNAPWISPTPCRSPWVASPQASAFDVGTRYSVFPITETVKLTPMKEISLSHSGTKHLQKDPIVQSGTSSYIVKGTPFFESKNVVVAPSQLSTEVKERKRKKISVSDEPGSSLLNSPEKTESGVSPLVTCISASGLFTTTPANLVCNTTAPTNLFSTATVAMNLTSTFSMEKPSSFLSLPIVSGNTLSGNLEMNQRSVLSEDAISKLKEATSLAEDASTLAAAAVSHSQYVWEQVDQIKYGGVEPAAANVAASAALQAKLMAEEASISNSSDLGNNLSKLGGYKVVGQATPASILKGDGASIRSNSVLTVVRDASEKRVAAATAATKQAENMDAIVKAAELAAEAVSQAGKLVSMGDFLSLNELAAAGLGGYWRHTQVSQDLELCERRAAVEKTEILTSHTGLDEPVKSAAVVSCSVAATGKKKKGQKVQKAAADLAKSDVSEPEAPFPSSGTQSESKRITETANGIKEHSSVEVFKEGPGIRAGWYSANVLSLKDGKAHVCYAELSSEEDKLKEWVALEVDGDIAPKIRSARSVTAMPFEGTRKRRRAVTGDHTWSVGDKVDAWVRDSWWEGVISEKNKKDETTLTVHFPVQGETLAVKSWNLLPSLVWKDGKWIECSSSGVNISSLHEGDTPNEKRPRLGSPVQEAEEKDNSSRNVAVQELGKRPQTGFLQLDVSEKTFNIGKSTSNENKPDTLRMKRTGLQKQGSRVIFGVPKPGKKRKFMEVSKHYVSELGSKTRQQNEPAKSVKPMMLQSSRSRAWRNTSKSDPRERQTALSKPKIFKPVSKSKEKASAASKTIDQKEDSQNISNSNLDTDGHKGTLSRIPTDIRFKETTEEQTASYSQDTSGFPSSKKTFSSLKAERLNKGRLAPAAGKLAKIEEDKPLCENSSNVSDGLEPRRSNRRIQPTSRLLEGLQTSSLSTKIPSVSHGKGQQNQSKSSSRGK